MAEYGGVNDEWTTVEGSAKGGTWTVLKNMDMPGQGDSTLWSLQKCPRVVTSSPLSLSTMSRLADSTAAGHAASTLDTYRYARALRHAGVHRREGADHA